MEKLSHVGNNIVGSEIIKISQQIKEISKTNKVLNLTIGDFDSNINPIPEKLKDYIIESYNENLTNYVYFRISTNNNGKNYFVILCLYTLIKSIHIYILQ